MPKRYGTVGDANPFNITADHRFGVQQLNGGEWRLTEEKRENGVWVFHRYVTEIETFPDITRASLFARDEAQRRRDALRDERSEAAWMKMRYHAAFLNEIPREHLPARLPVGWELRRTIVNDPQRGPLQLDHFYRSDDGLRVSMRYGVIDGKRWFSVNASYGDAIPDWETMAEVKRLFIGEHRYAFQIHPRKSDYVSISYGMLHLFTPLDGWNLPDLKSLL